MSYFSRDIVPSFIEKPLNHHQNINTYERETLQLI